jgi:hypothetical protein
VDYTSGEVMDVLFSFLVLTVGMVLIFIVVMLLEKKG